MSPIVYATQRAEELGIRDKLVIVLQSEMGRTPKYNSGNGKDHWSVGSIMFMGAGIQGNRVIGATNNEQFAEKIEPQTWKVDAEQGMRIRPEHIHLALRELAGIQDHPFSRKFPLDVKEACQWEEFWQPIS